MGPTPGERLVSLAPPFDRIKAHRPGRTGKTDQGGFSRQLSLHTRNGLIDRRQPISGFLRRHLAEVSSRIDLLHQRANALLELDTQAHRIEDQQDISEKDRCVHAIAANRLKRRFCCH